MTVSAHHSAGPANTTAEPVKMERSLLTFVDASVPRLYKLLLSLVDVQLDLKTLLKGKVGAMSRRFPTRLIHRSPGRVSEASRRVSARAGTRFSRGLDVWHPLGGQPKQHSASSFPAQRITQDPGSNRSTADPLLHCEALSNPLLVTHCRTAISSGQQTRSAQRGRVAGHGFRLQVRLESPQGGRALAGQAGGVLHQRLSQAGQVCGSPVGLHVSQQGSLEHRDRGKLLPLVAGVTRINRLSLRPRSTACSATRHSPCCPVSRVLLSSLGSSRTSLKVALPQS